MRSLVTSLQKRQGPFKLCFRAHAWESRLAWTIGTTADQADHAARRPVHPALRLAFIAALLAFVVLAILGHRWALPAAIMLMGARMSLGAAAEFRAARPPEGGPCFAIATLREGPV